MSRLETKTMPNGGVETYTYDAAGRQDTKTDAKGQTIQYGYDDLGRMTSRSYPDNSSVAFTYTNTGRRNTVADHRGTTTYTYDQLNRLSKYTYPDGQNITYGYDAAGRQATLASSLTATVTYSYYDNGRLKEVKDGQNNLSTYTYDAAGNRTGLAYPNGTTVAYTYDINNRLTNLAHKNSLAEVIASYAYTLGPIGNRTRIDEANGISRQYSYDKLYRLTNETVTDPTNAQTYTNDYTYDAVGNRQNKTNTAYSQSAKSNDYTYNNADQLLTENGVTYTYDLSGNLKTKTDGSGTTTYVYNYDDRLVQVQAPSGATVNYEYDADNNRVKATTAAGSTKYLVDTNRSLAQVLAEYSTTGVIIASYVYADDLVSMARGGASYYYHFDGLGSTRLLTDASGEITDTYEYDAFGNEIARTGTTENEFLFTGQQYDANVGFYYLRARYYQTTAGRLTTQDPFAGEPYAPLSLHRYLYAADDPINRIDPSGEESLISLSINIAITGILSSIAIAGFWSYRFFHFLPEDAFSGEADAVLYGFNGAFAPTSLLRNTNNPLWLGLAGAFSMYQGFAGFDVLIPANGFGKTAWIYGYHGGSISLGIPQTYYSDVGRNAFQIYQGKVWNAEKETDFEGPFYAFTGSYLPSKLISRVAPNASYFVGATEPHSHGWVLGLGGRSNGISVSHGKAYYLTSIAW